jgi:hypothetical protein
METVWVLIMPGLRVTAAHARSEGRADQPEHGRDRAPRVPAAVGSCPTRKSTCCAVARSCRSVSASHTKSGHSAASARTVGLETSATAKNVVKPLGLVVRTNKDGRTWALAELERGENLGQSGEV